MSYDAHGVATRYNDEVVTTEIGQTHMDAFVVVYTRADVVTPSKVQALICYEHVFPSRHFKNVYLPG